MTARGSATRGDGVANGGNMTSSGGIARSSDTATAGGVAGVAGVVGIGIDAVDIVRFREVLARRDGMVERMFTPGEREYADRANDPTQRYAARFAAKEALMKSLGVGLGAFGFHDAEVHRDDDGRPSLLLRGPAEALRIDRGVTKFHLSLTHTDIVAQAIVIASA